MEQKLVKFVEKPWGYEKWIAVTDQYAMKEIFLKMEVGFPCSITMRRKNTVIFSKARYQ